MPDRQGSSPAGISDHRFDEAIKPAFFRKLAGEVYGVLALPAGAPQLHDQLARDRQGRRVAVFGADDRERQIDPGSNPGGVSSGSIMIQPICISGWLGGTSRFRWRNTPPRGSFSMKLRRV
jgi:hypothetical protein